LPLTELRSQDHSRKHGDGSLDREAQQVDAFQQGYIAGWQSVRGADDRPVPIPASPVFVGPAMYVVSPAARTSGCCGSCGC
jgi:hypothetical protein